MKSQNGLYHLYLRARDKGVIFYTLEDRLVYYTVCAVKAKECDVRIAAAAIMFSHIHLSARTEAERNIRTFLQKTGTSFSRLYNSRYERTGRLFDRGPGQSYKTSTKEQRTNIIYVFNNHVEKGLCRTASAERWSFLAYADCANPFSIPYDKKQSSKEFLKACRLVDRRVKKLKPMEYCDFDIIFPRLAETEKNQFVDYVITKYGLIDFSVAVTLFGSIDALRLAAESTTGGEYDIREEYTRQSDNAYVELVHFASMSGFVKKIYTMGTAEKLKWIEECVRRTSASFAQLRKFFHEQFNFK